MKRVIRAFLMLLCVFFFQTEQADCGGLLYAFTPEMKGEFFPVARLSIKSSQNFVSVSDSVLEYNFTQTFINDNEFPLESLYILPIPRDVPDSGIVVHIDGRQADFRVLDRLALQDLVKKLVQKNNDHELLELWGERAVVIRPIYLETLQGKTIGIRYQTPHTLKDHLLNLKITLIGERYSLGPVEDLAIRVKFKMKDTVRTSLSSSHTITVTKEGPNRRLVAAREYNKKTTEDFNLITTFTGTEFNLRILNQNGIAGKNYFLLMLEPPTDLAESLAPQPDMDVVFVVDTSGSVGPAGLSFAKTMVLSAFERLRDSDRFNIISFGSSVKRFSRKLLHASKENKEKAAIFLNGLEAGGGSDLFNPLLSALELFNTRKRGGTVILLGDGRPTIGVTSFEGLHENIRRVNKYKSRIFVVGLGERSNIVMMDRLATLTGGKLITTSYNDPINGVLDRVFSEILAPNISDVSIDYQDIAPEDVFPDSPRNMNGIDTFFVCSAYEKSSFSSGKIIAKARIKGKLKSSTRPMISSNTLAKSNWIENVWAMRKAGRAADRELIRNDSKASDRLSSLCSTYGFVNPLQNNPAIRSSGDDLWNFLGSFIPGKVMSPEYRTVGDRLFRLVNGTWVDSSFQAGMPTREFAAFGEEFFSLLEKEPELGKFFCLGPQVTFTMSGVAISCRGMSQNEPAVH
jgi:Ca-activated chloride channel family protein